MIYDTSLKACQPYHRVPYKNWTTEDLKRHVKSLHHTIWVLDISGHGDIMRFDGMVAELDGRGIKTYVAEDLSFKRE